MKKGTQAFTVGIDRRTAVDRTAPGAFRTLQNARLLKRGETGYITPIEGYEQKFISNYQPTELVAISRFNDEYLAMLDRISPMMFKFVIVNLSDFSLEWTDQYQDEEADDYRIVRFGNLFFVSPHNRFFALYDGQWRGHSVISTTPTFSLSTPATQGNLQPSTFYWYRVRYVYRDGHKTVTAYPQGIKTTSSGSVRLSIDTVPDIDGNTADVEIFRSFNGRPFELIARETTQAGFTFDDVGQLGIGGLEERVYSWPVAYQAHEQVRDRYVRAGIDYRDARVVDAADLVEVAMTTGEVGVDTMVLPKNADIKIYVRFRFDDGSLSFHYLVDELTTGHLQDSTLRMRLTEDDATAFVPGRAVKEVAFFAQYTPKQRPAGATHTFDTVEIANKNLATIRSQKKQKTNHYLYENAAEKPANPKIFLGYKQITVTHDKAPPAIDPRMVIYDAEWDWDASTPDSNNMNSYGWKVADFPHPNFTTDLLSPNVIYLYSKGQFFEASSVTTGITDTSKIEFSRYLKKYVSDNASYFSVVYEMAALSGLKELARRGQLYIRLKNGNNLELSSKQQNNRYETEWVKVVDIEDTSSEVSEFRVPNGNVLGSVQNHVYLVLEAGTIYDDIDNVLINRDRKSPGSTDSTEVKNYGVISDYNLNSPQGKPVFDPQLSFEISAFVNVSTYSSIATTSAAQGVTEYKFLGLKWIAAQAVPTNLTALTFLGSIKVGSTAFVPATNTGFRKQSRNGVDLNELASDAIYETLVREEDLKTFDYSFPNQIVWSESFINNTDASEVRNFSALNFYNLSSQNGPIQTIRALGNALYVFCETGVAAVAVGEVMTQQTDQSVRINSSSLLNSEVWILRNLRKVAARSVVAFENMLFFYDGQDVWQFSGQFENITQGAIGELTGDVSATFDAKNREYRLTNGTVTFSFSLESGLWTGPHTISDRDGTNVGDQFYTVSGSQLRRQNVGTRFGNTPVTVEIESTADTLEDFQVVKLWRKFYAEVEGQHTFQYRTDGRPFTTSGGSRKYNGVTEYGVADGQKNGRALTWKIISSDALFKLKGLAYEFLPRLRR